jgi:SAM-dependent MidA family methyltransferase
MDNHQHQKIFQVISDRIFTSLHQRITFAEYMDLVLYHFEFGYYAKKSSQIGATGDFFTSPHLGSDFAECLAKQFEQMWEILERPHPFQLVEMGAGQGIIAKDILTYIQKSNPDLFAALEYIIIEKSPQMQVQQRRLLIEFERQAKWYSWDEIAPESIYGCCFSNELIDAFPVHQVIVKDGKLKEIYVTLDPDNQSLKEITDEVSTVELQKYFESLEIDITSYEDGYRTEVNLESDRWLQTVADKLKQGYVITIDYGYSANRYYNPFRSEGTLQCYFKHQYHNNPYINLGNQDLTSHVNFTALEITGENCGLKTVDFTKQGMFLMALGLGEYIASLSQIEVQNSQEMHQVLQRRQALHQLIDPMGLGNFGVLIQSKGLTNWQEKQQLMSLQTGAIKL